MRAGFKTTEFWTAIITNCVGIAVLFGAVNVTEGEEIGNALKAIAGAVITIATTLGYIKSRTDLKAAKLTALMGQHEDPSNASTSIVAKIEKLGI